MSKRYAVSGPNQSAAAPQTMAQIASPATVRANIYDLLVGSSATAEPTYNAVFALNFGMNQRATFRWVAAPGGEVMSAAGAASGFGAKVHTSTATLIENCTVHWWE